MIRSFILFLFSIFVGLVMGSTDCHAEGLTIGVHVGSQHLPAKPGQNNVNPGLYVRADSWMVGAYHNTYRETTVYAARTVTEWRSIELVAGVAYGYQYHTVAGVAYGASRGAFTPMAGLTYAPDVKIMGARPRIWLLPPTPKNSGVLHLSLEY